MADPAPDYSNLERDEAVELLGGVREEFRPHGGNLVAATIIGPAMVILGGVIVAYTLLALGASDPGARIVIGAGTLMMFSGTWALIWSLFRRTYRFVVCQDGFLECYRGRIRGSRWDQVREVLEPPKVAQHVPVSVSSIQVYYVVLPSGVKVKLDPQSVNGVERLLDLLRKETARQKVPWKQA